MCTVSYLPLSDGFILTSNRDESTLRKPALAPKLYPVFGETVCYPKDLEAHGTWIAASGEFTLCLLNGAFEKHISLPPYRKSRGLVLLDFFRFRNVKAFVSSYDFTGIEPFTMVLVEKKEKTILHELRWDGQKKYVQEPDTETPHIWSSTTLYTPEIIAQREAWFARWILENPDFSQNAILNFHRFGGNNDPANNLIMTRPDQKETISITSVQAKGDDQKMVYEDLLSSLLCRCSIPSNLPHAIATL